MVLFKRKNYVSEKKILLAAGILILLFIVALFLYLWFIKSTNHFGTWQQEVIVLNEDYSVSKRSYIKLKLRKDNSFIYTEIDKLADNKFIVDVGTYKRKDNKIFLEYDNSSDLPNELVMENGYLSFNNKISDNYLAKDEVKEVRVKYFQMFERINNEEYMNLKKLRQKVVVIVDSNECSHCATYEKILKEVYLDCGVKFYLIDSNEINYKSTVPKTLFLDRGDIVKEVDGYMEYDEMKRILNFLEY